MMRLHFAAIIQKWSQNVPDTNTDILCILSQSLQSGNRESVSAVNQYI